MDTESGSCQCRHERGSSSQEAVAATTSTSGGAPAMLLLPLLLLLAFTLSRTRGAAAARRRSSLLLSVYIKLRTSTVDRSRLRVGCTYIYRYCMIAACNPLKIKQRSWLPRDCADVPGGTLSGGEQPPRKQETHRRHLRPDTIH